MKPKTEKLLKYTPKDGTTYGYDEYAVILRLGKQLVKNLKVRSDILETVVNYYHIFTCYLI
jgi:hypothetical protein